MQAKSPSLLPFRGRLSLLACVLGCGLWTGLAEAHIVPPESLHPAAESYRRMSFLLSLHPIQWQEVERDAAAITAELDRLNAESATAYRTQVASLMQRWLRPAEGEDPPGPPERRADAYQLFSLSTRAVSEMIQGHLDQARAHLQDHDRARASLETARQIWAAFEHEVRTTDPESFLELGRCWLQLAEALGSPGVLGIGAVPPDLELFTLEEGKLDTYLSTHFRDRIRVPSRGVLAPVPAKAVAAQVPPRLPPGSEINKQLPRPRQILNMAARGVDESDTPLIALGDMAFDSPMIFGEPARSLGMSCNTCHNKGVTNPRFFIPGLSSRPGGVDVSNAFFAPHANNGIFDPLDIPDLRGLRFTAPYGRNGRIESLREFARNVIVNEFNGPEPDPLILDSLVAYMLEFDFLETPLLDDAGRLRAEAPEAARRGEAIFYRPFEQLAGSSCATCHVPSDHFLDRRRHDIGSATGFSDHSRDSALDTPTLLGSLYTAPYFHDGSLPTLRSVVDWFDRNHGLGLSQGEAEDLTAYLEVVGSGIEAYEDTMHTLESELEEFSFFLSTYELLRQRSQEDLIDVLLATIAFEVRAHKWDVQDQQYLPVLDQLADLIDGARRSLAAGDLAALDRQVADYRELYGRHVEVLQ